MITFLNRFELFADSSAEAAADVREKLKAAGIPFEMKTMQNSFSLFRAQQAGVGTRTFMGGMPGSSFEDGGGYVYRICVRKKDAIRAREVCGL